MPLPGRIRGINLAEELRLIALEVVLNGGPRSIWCTLHEAAYELEHLLAPG